MTDLRTIRALGCAGVLIAAGWFGTGCSSIGDPGGGSPVNIGLPGAVADATLSAPDMGPGAPPSRDNDGSGVTTDNGEYASSDSGGTGAPDDSSDRADSVASDATVDEDGDLVGPIDDGGGEVGDTSDDGVVLDATDDGVAGEDDGGHPADGDDASDGGSGGDADEPDDAADGHAEDGDVLDADGDVTDDDAMP